MAPLRSASTTCASLEYMVRMTTRVLGSRFDRDLPADQKRPFLHSSESRRATRGLQVGIESVTQILDPKSQILRIGPQLDENVIHAGVASCIRQCFLNDAERGDFQGRRE